MKATIKVEKQIELTSIRVTLPVCYGEEDIPNNFPLRKGDVWCAQIDLETGAVHGWPKGKSGELIMKVCDGGTYTLLDECGGAVASIEQNYVPHGVVPGKYGDYVELIVNEDGIITNWPKHPDVSRFFEQDDSNG
ncbi:MAG: hypothetical protein M1608_13440 [Candidatus Omnitrophica bacterium]|nr:hypothetical protein [Candidatus Omnitrophota bacterium]